MEPLRPFMPSSLPPYVERAAPAGAPLVSPALLPGDAVELRGGPLPEPAPPPEQPAATPPKGPRASDVRASGLDPAEAAFVNKALNPEGKAYPDVVTALEKKQSKVTVLDQGTVERVYPDDNSGLKHQPFDVRLGSGKTVRVAHNTEMGGRIPDLKKGLTLALKGEFIDRDHMNMTLASLLGQDIFLMADDIFNSHNSFAKTDGPLHWTHHANNSSHTGGGLVILSQGPSYHKVLQ